MVKIVTLVNFGLNNIDLEGRVEGNETSEQIRQVEMDVSGFLGKKTAFELPRGIAFQIIQGENIYYARLDTDSPGDPPKIFPNAGKGVTILADEKYDLHGNLQSSASEGMERFWQIKISEVTGGGGAHNTAFGQQVYLSDATNAEMKVRLVVPIGHELIRDRLPKSLEYTPLAGINNDNVPSNLNFAPVNGKKITLRSKVSPSDMGEPELGLYDGDVVILNTVRDPAYLGIIERTLASNREIRLFLSATDSMIHSIGKGKVLDLVARSEVYVSNREELEKLVGKKINDAQTLAEMMYQLQSRLLVRDGSLGRVYITFGQFGSVALGQDKLIYYQSTATGDLDPFKRLNIVNTNGCGDAYLSVVVINEIMQRPIIEILGYSNAAGHLCATMPTASGTWMATERKVKDFREKVGFPDFHRYDKMAGEFVRMRM